MMINGLHEKSKPGTIRNVLISNFVCQTEGRILLTAYEGAIMENITLRDIKLNYPMIEDPRPMVPGARSSQWPKLAEHPEAPGALAAIVADNVRNLVLDNVQIEWPRTATPPLHWQHPERIENGSMRIHRMDYAQARQTELSVFWGNRIQGGYLNNPLAAPSAGTQEKYLLKNTSMDIIR
jgi:hypothetical protein